MANWVASFLAEHPEYQVRPVFRRAKHGLHFRMPDGTVEAWLTGKPCHYQDEQGQWQPLDTAIRVMTDPWGGYGAPGIDVRLSLDGKASVLGGTWTQRTGRIGFFDPATKTFTSLAAVPNATIEDDKLVREIPGKGRHTIRLTEDGLRETLDITASLGGQAGHWLVLETIIEGHIFADGWQDSEFAQDKVKFLQPHAQDADGNPIACRRYARRVGNTQYLYTGVAVDSLLTATYPITIDPDFVGETVDGDIYGSDPVYATARSTSSAFNSSNTIIYVGQSSVYIIRRAFLKFNTASIGAGSTVVRAKLILAPTDEGLSVTFIPQVVEQDWSGQDPLSDANREAAYDNCLAGTAGFNFPEAVYLPEGYKVESGALTPGYVSKVGNTYYSLISNRDDAGTTPTSNEYTGYYSANSATAAYRPVLVVTYTPASVTATVLYPTVITTVQVDANDVDWTTVANMCADDATDSIITAATFDTPDYSYQAKLVHFNYVKPAGETVQGYMVEIERMNDTTELGKDAQVQLTQDGSTAIGSNYARTTLIWPTAMNIMSYGGPTDLWGTVGADPESDTFGILFRAQAHTANADIRVDFVRVTIYSASAGGGPAGVKTINDVLVASVKSVNDCLIASVKTINDAP